MLSAQRSLWDATAVPPPALRGALQGAHEADVLVVGGGFAGLSTALHLAERGVAVTVLEAAQVGAGASGRNGGQVLYGGRQTLAELQARYGEATAGRMHAFAKDAVDLAFAVIARLDLQCGARRNGSIYAADTDEGMAEVRAKLEALQRQGVLARWLDADALEEAIGTRAYRGGYWNPLAGSVQPLSLVRELARVAQEAGATIHEHSPALALAKRGATWEVATPQGRVQARRVLVATNGRAGTLCPALERSVLPVWSFQVATDPLPFVGSALAQGVTVSDTRRLLRYFRQDAEGRFIVGGKGTAGAPAGPASFNLQQDAFRRLWPSHAQTPIRHWWGGEVSVTLGRAPRFHRLGDGAYASVACNGKGVAWNVALGIVLADALMDVPLDTLPLPPPEPIRPLPLFPLRRWAAAAGASWYRLLDGLDRQRTQPQGASSP